MNGKHVAQSLWKYLLSATHDYLRPRFWAIIVPALVLVLARKIVTSDVARIVLFIMGYLVLTLLYGVFAKREQK